MATTTKAHDVDALKASILDRLIIRLADPSAPAWVKTWAAKYPTNVDGRRYNGLNLFALMEAAEVKGYDDPRWMTYRRGTDFGANVRKGEKGTVILSPPAFKQVKDANGNPVLKNGKPETYFCRPRAFTVFNVGQFENGSIPALSTHATSPQTVADVHTALDPILTYIAPVKAGNTDRACYYPSTDKISIPSIDLYNGKVGEYVHTFLHEAAHSTGHEARLKRAGIVNFEGPGSESYAFEELVADFTALFTAPVLGLIYAQDVEDNSLEYLCGWGRRLKGMKDANEGRSILAAAITQATAAMSYMTQGLRLKAEDAE